MNNNKSAEKLSSETLRKWMEEKRLFILIDTLPNDHYQAAHLPRAENACVFEVTFLEQVEAVVSYKESKIILYGSSAKTMDAVTAADKLLRAGYRDVTVLDGGITEWRAAGFAIEGDKADAPDETGPVLRFEDGKYEVDIEQSLIEWAGRNPNAKHFGTLRLSNGEVRVEGEKITGNFDIDMRSIVNTNLEGDELQPVLIAHLKSDDFFFVDNFPKAKFTIQQALPTASLSLTAPNYAVTGALSLCGVQAEIQFDATISRLEDGAIAAEAHFDIDRTRWNVIYGSSRFFEHLGMHLVFDPISIQIRIVAR